MKFLRHPIDYASFGVYSAPGKAWDGLDRLLLPSDGQLTQGATPDTAIPAELENGYFRVLYDAEAVQCHAALKQWSAVAIPPVGTDAYYNIVGLRIARGYGTITPDDTQRQVLALGRDVGAAAKVRVAHSADGSDFETAPPRLDSIASFTGVTIGIPGAAGELILLNDSVQFAYSSDSTSTWATQAFSGPPTIVGGLVATSGAAAGYYLIANHACYRANTLANLVAAPSVSSLPTPGSSPFGASDCDMAEGNGVLIVAGATTAPATGIYRSTDAGATWTLVHSPGGTHINVVWSDYWQLFLAWVDNGNLLVSATGAAGTWNVQSVVSLTPGASGFLVGQGSLVAVGPAIVKPVNYTSAYGIMSGVAYSLDLGLSWNYSYFFTHTGLTLAPAGLRAINGRVYATGFGRVWRSGILGAPAREL